MSEALIPILLENFPEKKPFPIKGNGRESKAKDAGLGRTNIARSAWNRNARTFPL